MRGKLLFLVFLMGLTLSLADSWPVTMNLKTGKTVLLNNDFTWSYYIAPVIRTTLFFHDANLGMTKDQFLKIYESKKSIMKESPEEGVSYFDDIYGGFPATLFFYFKNDTFVHGEAIFKLKKPKEGDFEKAFATLESKYLKRFGKPKNDAKFYKEWFVDGYMIRLVLTSQNNRLFLVTIFEDQQLMGKVVATSSPQPVQPEVKAEPVKPEPVKVEPVKTEPVKVAPVKEVLPPPVPTTPPPAPPKPAKSMDMDQLKELIDAL